MYVVEVENGGKRHYLHHPMDDELQLISPVVTLEAGKSGNFTFQIPPTHPNINKIIPLKSEINVYQDADIIFCGRSIGDGSDFYNIGSITCEGELSYLLDSMQRPFSHTGNILSFLQQVLAIHNSQVETRKQFKLGNVTITDTAPEVTRSNTACKNTMDTLKAQLTDIYGGYLSIRHAGEDRYLDYLKDYGGNNSQVIRFSENLINLNKSKDPTTIITALIPYGATPKTDSTSTETQHPVDISSVNGGKDYIYNQAAVDMYGWIWGTYTWKDITDPAQLKSVAEKYMENTILMPETVELNAVDLSLLDVDIQKLQIGRWTRIESPPHELSKDFMLSKKVIHLDAPGNDQVTLGQTVGTFTGSTEKGQHEVSSKVEEMASTMLNDIVAKINNATQLITGGKGGYIRIKTAEDGHPEEFLILDTPSIETAMNVWRFNKNGLGFSRTGYGGDYENAWTIDGNLVADFITAGTMLCDRLRGGTLEVGGTGLAKDGVILVKNSSGTIIVQIDKNGIAIKQGSINLGNGNFEVTSGGVMTLKGTSNNTTIGCSVLAAQYANIDRLIVNSNCEFRDISAGDAWFDDIQCTQIYSSRAGQWWSDRRLKHDIKNINPREALDIVMKLKPVTYILNGLEERSMGFVAQDVAELDTELPLFGVMKNGYYCLPYASYVSILAGAVQALADERKEEKRGRHKQGDKRFSISNLWRRGTRKHDIPGREGQRRS